MQVGVLQIMKMSAPENLLCMHSAFIFMHIDRGTQGLSDSLNFMEI